MDLSYCIVNTNGRDHLRTCLDAVRDTLPGDIEAEVLVLDNASDDGSAEAVREWIAANEGTGFKPEVRLIELSRRTGKAANDSQLLEESRGKFCLLLNEDAELLEGSVEALLAAMRAYPQAGAAGAQLLDGKGREIPCAWRLPGVYTSLASALLLHKQLVTQSGSTPRHPRTRSRGGGGNDSRQPGSARPAGWAQSAAMMVRREAAAEIGYLDPDFFVYSDETDFCKRLGDAGWITLHVPDARAVHHEQLATDRSGTRRIVEFHRNRDLYMRKHSDAVIAAVCRVLNTLPYLYRALAAPFLKGHSSAWYLDHAKYAFFPNTGEGIREAAEAYNRALDN